ncbi:MAG: sugar ABC transporter permease [Clostridiales bacterium]|nr:sugar ABC transporter permease [Clostridiales bacterium]MDY3061458.1 sugar ABC transporter permease [Eubacteriales bacterium]
MKGRRRYGFYFVLPGLFGLIVFFFVPFVISLYYALTKGIAKVHFVGLQNFRELLKNPAFKLAGKNTMLFILIGVPIITFISLFLSLLMENKLYKFPRWAMLSPMIVPVASGIMGWQGVLGRTGLVNQILPFLGVEQQDFFSDSWAMSTVMFIFIIKNIGFMCIIFSGKLSTLEREYKEVFLLESSSYMKYFWRVIVPLLSPTIFFVFIMGSVHSFQIFREVYALYGVKPPQSLYLLQHFMNNNFYKLNYQRLSTAAFILIIVISVMLIGFQRVSETRI